MTKNDGEIGKKIWTNLENFESEKQVTAPRTRSCFQTDTEIRTNLEHFDTKNQITSERKRLNVVKR